MHYSTLTYRDTPDIFAVKATDSEPHETSFKTTEHGVAQVDMIKKEAPELPYKAKEEAQKSLANQVISRLRRVRYLARMASKSRNGPPLPPPPPPLPPRRHKTETHAN